MSARLRNHRNPLCPGGSRRRGYTVVEVIMAIAVLTLGAAGVISMQKATLIANMSARNLVTATDVAQGWIERLRVDALAWNEPGGTLDLSQTQWLAVATTATSVWFAPTANNLGSQPSGAPQADVMGADIFVGDPSLPAFCPQIRLTRFADPTNTKFADLYRMIRIEVRVYWDKTGRPLDCTAPLPTTYELARYGFVYLVSSVLENNSPI
jgi:prepilin-type N-terminal cleavage/methylation domain-containing protein